MKHLRKFNEENEWKPDRRPVPENGVLTSDYEAFCPHCGIEQGEGPENIIDFSGDGGHGEYECDECEGKFSITKHISIEYVMEKL